MHDAAELWIDETTKDPDAWLLSARVAAIRTLRDADAGRTQVMDVKIAVKACTRAAALWPEDPTSHVVPRGVLVEQRGSAGGATVRINFGVGCSETQRRLSVDHLQQPPGAPNTFGASRSAIAAGQAVQRRRPTPPTPWSPLRAEHFRL